MRVLFWMLVIFAVVLWFMHGKKSRIEERVRKNAGERLEKTEPMVRCIHCGVHLPKSEALSNADGAQFCSEEHLRLHVPDSA